jgi:hypothetical protein
MTKRSYVNCTADRCALCRIAYIDQPQFLTLLSHSLHHRSILETQPSSSSWVLRKPFRANESVNSAPSKKLALSLPSAVRRIEDKAHAISISEIVRPF